MLLVSCVLARRNTFSFSLYSTWETRPHTVELTLEAGMQVIQPQEHECGRAGPATCLPCGDMGKGVIPHLSPLTTYGRQESWP